MVGIQLNFRLLFFKVTRIDFPNGGHVLSPEKVSCWLKQGHFAGWFSDFLFGDATRVCQVHVPFTWCTKDEIMIVLFVCKFGDFTVTRRLVSTNLQGSVNCSVYPYD